MFHKQIGQAKTSLRVMYLEMNDFFRFYKSDNLGLFIYLSWPNILYILLMREASEQETSFTLKARDLDAELYIEILSYFKV